MKKVDLLMICCLSAVLRTHVVAQTDNAQIRSAFPYIEYGEDSAIRLAANYVHLHLEGVAIEFDSLGKPLSIGHYKHGKKEGEWLIADGTSRYFKEGKEFGTSIPGCGTGLFEAQVMFRELYEKLVLMGE